MDGADNDGSFSIEKQIEISLATHSLRDNAIRSAIDALHLPLGSLGLDAGCGIGLISLALAENIGERGSITGVDIDPDLLEYAGRLTKISEHASQVEFKKGDIAHLPFDDNEFDWVWSCDCVGYAPLEPLPLVKELVRVVKPGGFVAILAWSSETLLPGYPELEAHLRGTTAGISPFIAGKDPKLNFLRALGWLEKAGMKERRVQTFAGEVHTPLSDELREAMITLFEMRWPGVREELSAVDREEFNRLCSPDSADFIVNEDDYYAFFTYSMFSGTVVE